jgi:antitoxin component YwqK of YwqJK toxin-antitoxin module
MNQFNDNGKCNGYWESYFPNGKLWYKGYYINGEVIGYYETYFSCGDLYTKAFFL